MEYIYAALLLSKLGKDVNEDNVKKILASAGASVEDARVKALVSALQGVDIEKEIKEAASMPVAVAAAPASGGEAKKEEKKEDDKKSEEQAAAGLGALFG